MPLFYVCTAFLAGIAAAGLCDRPAAAWLAVGMACLAAGLVSARMRGEEGFQLRWIPLLARLHLDPVAVPPAVIRALPYLAAAAFALGAGRWSSVQPVYDDPGFIAYFNEDETRYTVIGLLAAPPDVRDAYTNLRVEAVEIRPASGFRHLPVRGLVLARVDGAGDWAYGDRVTVTGRLQTPPQDEDFSYRDYLARQGIYAYMPFSEAVRLERDGGNRLLGWIFRLKARAQHALQAVFPDPEASLLSGILLGLDRGLSPDLQEAFRDTGTSHIIAISGFNISIIAALAATVFSRLLGPRTGAFAAVLAIGGYTILVGADAAVVRAALMGGMATLLRRAGRTQSGLNALSVTAAVMAFANPQILSDVGFQLSFAATLGLILYTEPLTQAFAGWAIRYWRISTVRRALPLLSDAVLLTLAAQIATLPVILYHFERLSLSAFLVNPLVLPVQPAVMVLGGLAMLSGMVWLPAGRVLGLTALPFVTYSIRMVELFGGFKSGVLVVGKLGPATAALIGLGPMVLRAAEARLKQVLPVLRVALVLALLGAVVVAWRTAASSGNGLLRVWVLDVGMGEAVLVQTPADRWVLVNGGPSAVRLSDQLGRRLPLLQRRLDWLVVAGTADVQLSALPRVLEQYPPAGVLWAGIQNNSQDIRNMQDMMNKVGLEVIPMASGQALDLGAGARLEVLATSRRGAVLLLVWQDFRLLLPAGPDFDTLLQPVPPVSAMLLPDSGYAPLNPAEWIARLQPGLVLLSVEAGNREGLPDPALADFLASFPLLRTDRHGWIELSTDGRHLWVSSGKR